MGYFNTGVKKFSIIFGHFSIKNRPAAVSFSVADFKVHLG